MKVLYDPEVDILSVLLSDAPVAESDRHKPGLILDYDAASPASESTFIRPSNLRQ